MSLDDRKGTPEDDAVRLVLHQLLDNQGIVLAWVARNLVHLGARPEWSMEDNFMVTEGLASLGAQVGLPPAGNQTPEALAFYELAERGGQP